MDRSVRLLEEQQRLNDLALQIQNTEQTLEQLRVQRLVQIGRVQLLTEQAEEAKAVQDEDANRVSNHTGEPADAMTVLDPGVGTSEP